MDIVSAILFSGIGLMATIFACAYAIDVSLYKNINAINRKK